MPKDEEKKHTLINPAKDAEQLPSNPVDADNSIIPEVVGPAQLPAFVTNEKAQRSAEIAASKWKPKDLKIGKNRVDYLLRVASHIRYYEKITSALSVKIGFELIKAREILPNRGFKEWLRISCGISRSTAYNYMQIAQKVTDPQSVVQFSFGTLLKITSDRIPDDVRKKALEADSDAEAMTIIKEREKTEEVTTKPSRPITLKGKIRIYDRLVNQVQEIRKISTLEGSEDKKFTHLMEEVLRIAQEKTKAYNDMISKQEQEKAAKESQASKK